MIQLSNSHWPSHVLPTIKLALPVMLSRAGILVLALVDTMMCGWAGPVELAYYGLGSAPSLPLLLIGIGLLLGTIVLTAQAEGAGRLRDTGAIWRVSVIHGLIIGLITMLLCQFGEEFLLWSGQSAELSAGGGRVLSHFGWGLPGALMFSASIFFLEALQRPLAGMVIMLLANLANAFLNWCLIFGNLGFPEMGAAGAALATSISRWLMFTAVVYYLLVSIDRVRYGITGSYNNYWALGKQFRRVGYPIALGQGLESLSFTVLTLYAGWMGANMVAAWTISVNVLATIFMFSLGFTTAAGIRVSNAVGRSDYTSVAYATWVATGLTFVFIGTIAIGVAMAIDPIVSIYADSPAIIGLSAATLIVTAWALVPDGIQAVLIGALRGVSDFWPATSLQIFSWWGVVVPLGYYLGIYRDGDAGDLMMAVALGALVSTLLLGWRFIWLCRQFPSTASDHNL